MNDVELVFLAVVIGIGATVFMDIFAWIQNRLLNIPGLNYALVGRWIIGMGRGKFIHHTILTSTPIRFERHIGWMAHYMIGVLIVGWFLMITGSKWVIEPSLWQSIVLGLFSVSAPFLIMQPMFGFGLAASKMPRPWVARRRSVVAHLSFGVGVYVACLVWGLIV